MFSIVLTYALLKCSSRHFCRILCSKLGLDHQWKKLEMRILVFRIHTWFGLIFSSAPTLFSRISNKICQVHSRTPGTQPAWLHWPKLLSHFVVYILEETNHITELHLPKCKLSWNIQIIWKNSLNPCQRWPFYIKGGEIYRRFFLCCNISMNNRDFMCVFNKFGT